MAIRIENRPLPYSDKTVAIGGASSLIKTVVSSTVIPASEEEEAISQSYLGTPVVDNLNFPEGKYVDLNGNVINYPNVFINTVVFEVNRTKRIIETNIQGRDNSVFEYIGNSNYEVTCNGILSVKDNVFPLEASRALQKIFDVPQQIEIVSAFLNEVFEIFNVVIRSHRISQEAGKRNSIPFSFVASQDVDLDVKELE
jgi:hypothetical protein